MLVALYNGRSRIPKVHLAWRRAKGLFAVSDSPIVVRGLSHKFTDGKRSLPVLKDIDLTIERGEFVTLIGPSGCGKTTLLNILSGLLSPTHVDQLLIEDQPLTKPNPKKIALVFQESGLFFWKTALANVEFGLELRGVPKRERQERAMRYLQLTGLKGSESKYPSQLSGGMKQRVSLARALSLETPILIMDEPFGALDEQTRLIMSEELLRVCSEGRRTVLFVTHSLQEAALVSSRIVVLSSRPAAITEIIKVDSPRPRRWEDVERVRERLWELLRGESLRALDQDG